MLVSIVITTHGRTDFLRKAVKSALVQSYPKTEVIVVDDNANDAEIRQAVKDIMAEYPQCKTIYNETNLGGSLSRNVGIEAATGECIAFLDDDDVFHSDRVEKAVELYQEVKDKKIGLIYSYCAVVDENGARMDGYHRNAEGIPLYEHMLSCLAATSQWFCPKEALVNVGMFEDAPCKQDSIMLLKLLVSGYEVRCIPEELIDYTEHNRGRISGVSEKNIRGLLNWREWCRKYYDALTQEQIDAVEVKFARDLVTFYSLLGQRKEARDCLQTIKKYKGFSKEYVLGSIKCALGKKYRLVIRGIGSWKRT